MENKEVNLRELFISLDYDKFKETFSNAEDCLAILAENKWKQGFICRKCGGTRFCKGKNQYARRCSSCKTEESATAHTIFHHCRMELPLAFEIAYRVCGQPEIKSSTLSEILETRHMTCLQFKKKIMQCIRSQGRLEQLDIKKAGHS